MSRLLALPMFILGAALVLWYAAVVAIAVVLFLAAFVICGVIESLFLVGRRRSAD
jgi:hypothetical protein